VKRERGAVVDTDLFRLNVYIVSIPRQTGVAEIGFESFIKRSQGAGFPSQ